MLAENNLSVDRDAAREGLMRAAQYGSASRVARTLRKPFKMIIPVAMRKLGTAHDIELDTFWGGHITGTLPEAVSSVIWRNGYFDKGVSLTLLETLKPGNTFIDIGAHFGYFSLLASWLVGSEGNVVSVEAMPKTFTRLTHNLDVHNAHQNALPVNLAAYSHKAELTFQDYGLAFSSLNSAFGIRSDNETISATSTVKIDARPLDDILAPMNLSRIDLVKIDAESSEIFVLQGMTGIIDRFGPDIIVEIGDVAQAQGGASREIVDLLADQGYKAFRRINDRLELIEIQDNYGYDNFLFRRNP